MKHCNIFFDMDEHENINYKISIMDHDINQIVITEKDENFARLIDAIL